MKIGTSIFLGLSMLAIALFAKVEVGPAQASIADSGIQIMTGVEDDSLMIVFHDPKTARTIICDYNSFKKEWHGGIDEGCSPPLESPRF